MLFNIDLKETISGPCIKTYINVDVAILGKINQCICISEVLVKELEGINFNIVKVGCFSSFSETKFSAINVVGHILTPPIYSLSPEQLCNNATGLVNMLDTTDTANFIEGCKANGAYEK